MCSRKYTLPMKKKTTPFPTTRNMMNEEPADKLLQSVAPLAPSEKTLAFLRAFARNYQVIPQLPHELQGLMLS